MSEELTGQAGGVGPVEAATPQGAAETPTAEPTAPATAEPTAVNLDDVPEFRQWKSRTDSRMSQMRAELARTKQTQEQAQRQLTEAQQYVDQARLQDAEPQDVAAYYQKQMADREAQYQQAQAEQRQAMDINQRGAAYLQSVGIDPDTPELDWSGGLTERGLTQLVESASRLILKRSQEAVKAKTIEVTQVAKQAGQQALDEAGVSKVSTATGAAGDSLQAEWAREKAKYKYGVDPEGFIRAKQAMRTKYRERGLELP